MSVKQNNKVIEDEDFDYEDAYNIDIEEVTHK